MSGQLTQRDAHVHTVALQALTGQYPHICMPYRGQYLCRRMSSRSETCALLPPIFERRSSWMHLQRVTNVRFIAAVIPALEEQPPNNSMGMQCSTIRPYHWPLDMYLYGFLRNNNVSDGPVYIFQMPTFPVSRADSDLRLTGCHARDPRSPADLSRRYGRIYKGTASLISFDISFKLPASKWLMDWLDVLCPSLLVFPGIAAGVLLMAGKSQSLADHLSSGRRTNIGHPATYESADDGVYLNPSDIQKLGPSDNGHTIATRQDRVECTYSGASFSFENDHDDGVVHYYVPYVLALAADAVHSDATFNTKKDGIVGIPHIDKHLVFIHRSDVYLVSLSVLSSLAHYFTKMVALRDTRFDRNLRPRFPPPGAYITDFSTIYSVALTYRAITAGRCGAIE
ncbi:uncharacterized protein ARMOST_18650 [Armillaria ostoyae]|uniref:Uncharacterized protein n=1 Tax=Armillaria ostoyae TaxID=47428 RepID=A0A284S2E0_ARMOS|nr:uncharacterized protein ARMOST_18650 [Armillaria ostoyae]